MSARFARIAFAGIVLGSGACLFPSLGGLSGPGDAAPETGTDVAIPDAAGDGPIVESGADGDAGPYCSTLSPTPLFCADFDEGSVTAGWDSIDSYLGTVALSNKAVSAPASALASVNAGSSGYLQAALKKTFPAPAGNSVLAFDMAVEQIDPAVPYTKLVSLTFGGETPHYVFFLQVLDPTHLQLVCADPTPDGGVNYCSYGTVPMPQLGAWTHVQIDLFKSSTDTTVTSGDLWIDGSPALTSFGIGSVGAFGTITLDLGVAGVDTPSNAWSVHVDNVVFDEK